jgi:hypothetical protein
VCNRLSAGPDVGGAPWPIPTPAVRGARLRLCRIVQFARRQTRCRTKPHSTRLDLSADLRDAAQPRDAKAARRTLAVALVLERWTRDLRPRRAQWTACATGCTATTSWDRRTRSTSLAATAPSSHFQQNRWFAVVRPRGAERPDRAHNCRSIERRRSSIADIPLPDPLGCTGVPVSGRILTGGLCGVTHRCVVAQENPRKENPRLTVCG